MRNGPELWAAILKGLPIGAVIAGGAVRDFMLGVEPRDIDIFMKPDGWIMNRPEGFDRIDDKVERECEYTALGAGIESVSRGQLYGFSIDVIEIETPSPFDAAKLVEGFDFAIARSWFDGQIQDTVEAQLDRYFRCVSLLISTRPERARRRFERFNKRMSGAFTYRDKPYALP